MRDEERTAHRRILVRGYKDRWTDERTDGRTAGTQRGTAIFKLQTAGFLHGM
jgi:hypothetical protein